MQTLLLTALLAGGLLAAPDAAASGHNATVNPPLDFRSLPTGAGLGDVSFACRKRAPASCRISEFMVDARICAIVVVEAGKIRFQKFNGSPKVCREEDRTWEADGPKKHYGLASVTKSITSTLLGHVIAKKQKATTRADFEAELGRPVDRIINELGKGSSRGGYAGVPLERVLSMRSNVRWREYGWFSDSARFKSRVRDFLSGNQARKESVVQFARRYAPRRTKKTEFNYSGLDAAVVAAAAERLLNGQKLTAFLEAGLWASIGAREPASFGVDKTGTPIGHCCTKMTIGDLARFGLLVLDRGRDWRGRRIIPDAWFELATGKPGLEDAIPAEPVSSDRRCRLSYRFFWWLRPGRTDFTAVGLNGQFLHVYPDEDTVIVQIGDWGNWEDGDERRCETLLAHDALAAAAGR